MFSKYENILRWLSKEWDFISPVEFSEILEKKEVTGKKILLTFDDGFISDYYFSKEILNPMGIRALHFIITDFMKIEDNVKSKHFLEYNLYPKWKGELIPNHRDELINMRLKHLKFLISIGHEIGSHTKSHQRLSNIKSNMDLKSEIIDGADELETMIDNKINHFAFTFGDLESFSKRALDIAKTRFKYIYTGLRGNNAINPNNFSIKRDSIGFNYTKRLIGSFLYGASDLLYKEKFKIYNKWKNNL